MKLTPDPVDPPDPPDPLIRPPPVMVMGTVYLTSGGASIVRGVGAGADNVEVAVAVPGWTAHVGVWW